MGLRRCLAALGIAVSVLLSSVSAEAAPDRGRDPTRPASAWAAESSPGSGNPWAGVGRTALHRLVLLATDDLASFQEAIRATRASGGEVLIGYPPSGFIATLPPKAERAVVGHRSVARVEAGPVNLGSVRHRGPTTETAVSAWNVVFNGAPDPIADADTPGPAPTPTMTDAIVVPQTSGSIGTRAPGPSQTAEYMAGTIVVSIMFVESSGGAGYCAPPDPQTENWDAGRQATVVNKISAGLAFWTARANRPSPLTFVVENLGSKPTSCEPITRNFTDMGRWLADALTASGYPTTPTTYSTAVQALVHSRRTAYGADWAVLVPVVDSLNDTDGQHPDGWNGWASLNFGMFGLTYDNGGWGISRMHLVAAHELGHVFGALDEYAPDCKPTDSWGYLNQTNDSCNVGGINTDVSIMGPAWEMESSVVDVSTAARAMLGWRNPTSVNGRTVVDVVRTSAVSLAPLMPDPFTGGSPTFAGIATNSPFPPGGCNMRFEFCQRTPSPVSIARVAGVEWNIDGGGWTTASVAATDGTFDGESEGFRFTLFPPAPFATHVIAARAVNSFGHISNIASDTVTLIPCTAPRPPIRVQVSKTGDHRLQVTVSAGVGSLSGLQFGAGSRGLTNAVVDVANGPTGITTGQTVSFQPGTTTATFFIRQRTAGAGASVPFVATDACGPWESFAGGGVNAF